MKEFLIGSLIGTTAGLIIGGVMVARNKKLSSKINQGLDNAEEKLQEAKQTIQKKLKECKIGEEKKAQEPECDPNSNVCC